MSIRDLSDKLKLPEPLLKELVESTRGTVHVVIIETPEHNKTTALLPLDHIEHILNAYRERLIAFYEDPRVEHVIIFKNHGAEEGTSLEHPILR